MDENTTTTTTTAPASAAEAAQPGLTIQDLNLALQVIQVSSTRGAFRAEELSMVGGLHDRIYKFLEATGAFKTSEATPAATPVTPAAEKPKKAKAKAQAQ